MLILSLKFFQNVLLYFQQDISLFCCFSDGDIVLVNMIAVKTISDNFFPKLLN